MPTLTLAALHSNLAAHGRPLRTFRKGDTIRAASRHGYSYVLDAEPGTLDAEFRPDLILLDMRMPGIDGFEVCSMIRKDPLGKGVKIIIVSGMMDMDGVEKIAEMGANDFLAKPFRNEFLKLKVERILGIE